nr:DUF2971 domain-containing protein [Sphingomonas sp. CFBP 13728]
MLVKERITLLNPSSWEDENDIAFLEAYRLKRNLPAVFATCFTQAPETFHHWSVFANGHEGVRINIDKEKLLEGLRKDPCYSWGEVEYKTYEQLENITDLSLFNLPFLKRYAFTHEDEFRIVYDCSDAKKKSHDIKLKREWIKDITLSPWLHPALIDPIKEAIKSLPHCKDLTIKKTNLRNSERWKKAIAHVAAESEPKGGRKRQD